MATFAENTTRIIDALGDIKSSIIAKGVTPSGRCETFADAIDQIETSSGTDVSDTTATAGDVLSGETFHTANGTSTLGTMTNNGSVSQTLDTTTTSYTIPEGYHDGTGTVGLVTQTKSVTATGSSQSYTPDAGKVLSKVTVAVKANTKVVYPMASSTQTDIGPNSGYNFISNVTVGGVWTDPDAIKSGVKVRTGLSNNGDVLYTGTMPEGNLEGTWSGNTFTYKLNRPSGSTKTDCWKAYTSKATTTVPSGFSQVKTATVTVPGNTNYTVDVGFRPKYIMIHCSNGSGVYNPTDAGSTAALIYDESISTTTVYVIQPDGYTSTKLTTYTLPITSGQVTPRIRSIENNGFIFRGSTSAKTFRYTAIG